MDSKILHIILSLLIEQDLGQNAEAVCAKLNTLYCFQMNQEGNKMLLVKCV